MLARLKGQTIAAIWLVGVALAALITPVDAQTPSGDPIKIGFGMALTGPLAPNGKMSLVAMKIWEEDVNAKGGLLGRPVKLIYYDDQSNPSTVPNIYIKLLDVDKVDFAVSPYASTQIAPAMPIMMQKKPASTMSSTTTNISRCCRPGRRRSRHSPKVSSMSP
jgi:branched-chain amino acid transport system substrate-binding protein